MLGYVIFGTQERRHRERGTESEMADRKAREKERERVRKREDAIRKQEEKRKRGARAFR